MYCLRWTESIPPCIPKLIPIWSHLLGERRPPLGSVTSLLSRYDSICRIYNSFSRVVFIIFSTMTNSWNILRILFVVDLVSFRHSLLIEQYDQRLGSEDYLHVTDLLFSYRQDLESLQKSGQDHLSRTPLSSPPGRKRDMSEHRTRQSSGLECSTSVPPGLLYSKGAPCGWTRSHVLQRNEYRKDQGLVGNN